MAATPPFPDGSSTPPRRLWMVAGVFLLSLSTILSSVLGSVAASAATPSQTTVAQPGGVRAVATPSGTDVFITQPSAAMVIDPVIAPTSYSVAACGPYALDSVQMTEILSKNCSADPTATSRTVTADKAGIGPAATVPCAPTSTTWCLIVVQAINGGRRSTPIRVGSGGNPPTPVTDLVAIPDADGHSVTMQWAAGPDAPQATGVPALTLTYEVRRNGVLIASGLSDLRYRDETCGSAARCAYEVVAASPAGRATPSKVAAVTLGVSAPSMTVPTGGFLIPGQSFLSGALGQGASDVRDVEVTFVPVAGGSPLSTQAASVGASWNLMVPATLAAGRYKITASQGGHQSTPVISAVAADVPLRAGLANGAPSAPAGSIPLEGTAVAGVVGSPVGFTDVPEHSTRALGASTQQEMARRFAEAPRGTRSTTTFVTPDDGGRWTGSLVVEPGAVGTHLVKVTQDLPGGVLRVTYFEYEVNPATPLTTSNHRAPLAPSVAAVTAGTANVSVTWRTPAAGIDPITRYLVWSEEDPSKSCSVEVGLTSTNTCTVKGLTPGNSYRFRAAAVNAVGVSPHSALSKAATAKGPPSAPAAPTAAGGNASATVSWTTPASNGSAITGYKVTSSPGGKSCTTTTLTSCKVTGLSNGISYTFTVTATNALGTSVPSPASAAVVPAAAPSAPAAPTVTAGNTTVTVSWTAPASNGSAITGYKVTSSPGGKTCATTSTSCVVSGLTNGTSYTFTVAATNAVGTSTSPASSVTIPATVPGSPTNITTTGGDTTVTVAWKPPTNTGGIPITSYVVKQVYSSTVVCTAVVGQGAANTCTVRGLANGRQLQFVVAAVNAMGVSADSMMSLYTTVGVGPSAVTNVVGTPRNTSVSLSWTAPASAGSKYNATTPGATGSITRYDVSIFGGNGGSVCTLYVSGLTPPATSCTVSNLTNGTSYQFVVTATNDSGIASPASTPSAAVIPVTLAAAPTEFVVLASENSAALRWTPPTNTGGAPLTGFLVTAQPPSGSPITQSFPATATSGTLTGLTTDVAYQVSIQAVTRVGAGTPSPSVTAMWTLRPAVPVDLVVLPGVGSAVVSWTQPPGSSYPIVSYTVRATDRTNAAGTVTKVVGSNPAGIGGLIPGDTYVFTVAATSIVGTSAASSASSPVSLAPPPGPLNPTAFLYDYVGAQPEGEIEVSWSAPDTTGFSPITGYLITAVSPDGSSVTMTTDAATLSASVTGLTPWTAYSVSVNSIAATGMSATIAAGIVVPPGPPIKPSGFTAVANGNNLHFTFDPTNRDTSSGGTFSIRSDFGIWCRNLGVNTCDMSWNFGLTAAWTLVATNRWGSSSSDAITLTPVPFPPAAPTSVHVVAGYGTATLSWHQPGDPVLWDFPLDLPTWPRSFTANVVGDPTKACSVDATQFGTDYSCTISGLTAGTTYQFSVTSAGDYGMGTSTPVAAVPMDRPTAPSISSVLVGDSQLAVAFSAATTPVSSISAYRVTADDGNGGVTTSSCATSPCVVPGLSNATTYAATVVAVNTLGGESLPSDPVSSSPFAPPVAATNPRVLATSDQSVTVAFDVSQSSSSPFDHYLVTAANQTTPGPTTPVSCPAGSGVLVWDRCEVTGLLNGDSYVFSIVIVGAGGSSSATSLSTPAIPAGVPSAPEITAVAVHPTSAVVTYSPSLPNGAAVTSYVVRITDSTSAQTSIQSLATSPATITGLTNGDAYAFEVAGVNIQGQSAWSASSSTATPTDVPATPTNVQATGRNGVATITFDAPNANGAPITGYEVVEVASWNNWVPTILHLGPTLPLVIPGLRNSEVVGFEVAATNAVGTSGWSSGSVASPGIVVSGPPDPPVIDQSGVYGGNGETTLYFSRGFHGGYGITSFTGTFTNVRTGEVITLDQPVTSATQYDPVTFTGLTNGQTYSLTLTETSRAGTSGPSGAVLVQPLGPPPTPIDVHATLVDGLIYVSWTEPPNTSGAPINQYMATASGIARSCVALQVPATTPPPPTSCVIVGAGGVSSDSVTVVAKNALGASSPSAAVSTILGSGPSSTVSSPPTNVTMAGYGTQLLVRWNPPADTGGGAITGYIVTLQPGAKTCTSVSSLSCWVTGVDPYALYTATVIATDSVGPSAPSDPSPEGSVCGIDLSVCASWLSAGHTPTGVLATQVHGGIRVSWFSPDPTSSNQAVASPSGRRCTAAPGVTDLSGRVFCIIAGDPGAFPSTEVVHAEEVFYGGPGGTVGSTSVHPTWWDSASVRVPALTNSHTPQATGTITGDHSSVQVAAAPASCPDPYACPDAVMWTTAVSGGVFTVDLTEIPDGTYSVFVDGFNMTGGTAPLVEDTTPPTPLSVGAPPGIPVTILEPIASVVGTAECDLTTSLSVAWFVGSTTTGSPVASSTPVRSSGPVCTYSDLQPQLADGTYTVVVSMTDAAGNTAASSTTALIDSVAPTPAISTPADSAVVPAGVVAVTGTSPAHDGDVTSVQLVATSGGTSITRVLPLVAGQFSTMLNLDAGVWSLAIRQSDAAGNARVVTESITVQAAPRSPSIVLPLAGARVAATTTVAGWASPGATVLVGNGTTTLATVTADATGWWSTSLTLAAGTTSVVAQVDTDRATVAVSVGSPSSALSIVSVGRGGIVSSAPILGTAAPGATLQVNVDGALSSLVVPSSGVWSLNTTGFPAGSHALSVTRAASSASATFFIDRTAPALTFLQPAGGASTRSSTISVTSASVEQDCSSVTFSYFSGGSVLASKLIATDSVEVINGQATDGLPAQTPNGSVTVLATRCDAAGNRATAVRTFTFDTVPPRVTSNLADFMAGPLTLRGVTGTASGDQTLTVTIDGTTVTPTVSGAGVYVQATQILSGTHEVRVEQSDAAGNGFTDSRTVTVLSTPPDLSLDQESRTAVRALTVSGSASGDGGPVLVTVTPDDPTRPTVTQSLTPTAGRYSLDPLSALSDSSGYWTVEVTRSDAAGNISAHRVHLLIDPVAPTFSFTDGFGTYPPKMFNTSSVTVTGLSSSEPWRAPVQFAIIEGGSGRTVATGTAQPIGGRVSFTTPALSDGSYEVRVGLSDPLYRLDPISSGYFVVDRVAPNFIMFSSPTPTQTLCGYAGGSLSDIRFVTATYSNPDGTVAETSTFEVPEIRRATFCAAPSRSGTYDVTWSQRDEAGNLGSLTRRSVTFDVEAPVVGVSLDSFQAATAAQVRAMVMRAPVAPVAITGTAGIALGDAASVQVTLIPSGCTDVVCALTRTLPVTSAGTWSLPLNTVPAGTWQFASVTQSDWASRVGSFVPGADVASRYSFIVNQKPAAPTLTVGDAASYLRGTSVTASVCPSSSVALSMSIKIYRGPATGTPQAVVPIPVSPTAKCTTTTFLNYGNLTTLPSTPSLINGVYTLVAQTADAQGNVTETTISYTSRYTQPTPTVTGLTTSQSATLLSSAPVGSLPVLRGTGWVNDFDTRSLEIYLRPVTPFNGYGTASGYYALRLTTTLQSDGTWSVGLPSTIPSGDLAVEVIQGSGRGNGTISVTSQGPTVDTATMQGVSVNGTTKQSLTVGGTIPLDRPITGGSLQVTSPTLTNPTICSNITVTGSRWSCTAVGTFPDGVYSFKVTTLAPVAYSSCYSYPVGDGTYTCSWSDLPVGQPSTSPVFTSGQLKGSLPVPILLTPQQGSISSVTGQILPLSGPVSVTGSVSTAPGDLPGVTIKVYAGPTATGTPAQTLTATASSSTNQFAKTVTLADGTWTIQVTQLDSSSNKGVSNAVTIVEDSTGPSISTTWPTSNAMTVASGAIYGTISGGVGAFSPTNIPLGIFGSGFSMTEGIQRANQTTSVGTISYYAGSTATGTPVVVDTITTNPSGQIPGVSTQFVDQPTLSAGTYTAVISAKDLAQNTTVKTLSFVVSPSAAPALSAGVTGSVIDPLDATRALSGTVHVKAGFQRISMQFSCPAGVGACPQPTGSVTVFDNATAVASSVVLSQGALAFNLELHVGGANHVLTFSYTGDPIYRSSTAAALATVIVDPISPDAVNLQTDDYYGAASVKPLSVLRTYRAYDPLTSASDKRTTFSCAAGATTVTNAGGRVIISSPSSGTGTPSQSIGAGTQTMTVVSGAAGDCAASTVNVPLTLRASPVGAITPADPNALADASGSGWARIAYNPASAVVVGRDINLSVTVAPPLNDANLGGWPTTNIPIWLLGPDGNRIEATKQLVSFNSDPSSFQWLNGGWSRIPTVITLHYTPSTAGLLRLVVVEGGGTSGYAEVRAEITLAVEPTPLPMTVQFTPSVSHPGQTQTAQLLIGSQTAAGQVLHQTPTPGGGVTILQPPVTCAAAGCTAPISLVGLENATSTSSVAPVYVSAATGRSYLAPTRLSRSPWPSTMTLTAGAGSPRGVRVTPSADRQLTVDWVAPAANNSTITGYSVTTDAGPTCTTGPSATSCVLTGLTDGVDTAISVRTLTTAGSSAPVSLTAAASATVLTQDPNPTPTATPNTTTRDQLLPVTITLAFDPAMATSLRAGSLRLTSAPWTSPNPFSGCGNGIPNAFCSGTKDETLVNLSTGAVTRTLNISNTALASIPSSSLTSAGLSVDALTPTSSVSWTGNTLTLRTQVYVGGGPFDLTARFTPSDTTAVSGVGTGDPQVVGQPTVPAALRITGVGAPVLKVMVASAVVTGGIYAPRGMSSRSSTTLSRADWEGDIPRTSPRWRPRWDVRNPRIGETAYVRAQADPIFFAPSDRQIGLALSEAVPTDAPVFVDADFPYNQTFTRSSVKHLSDDATYDGNYSCTDCAIWSVRNLDPSATDPRTGGGLAAGTSQMGVIAYAPGTTGVDGGSTADLSARLGIRAFPLVVDPWPTAQATTASLSGSTIQVLTAARWPGMGPEVQTSLGNVAVSVMFNHSGTSTMIAYCFYSGVCLKDDGNGETYRPVTVVAVGARLGISIDMNLGFTLRPTDSVTVTTSTPWGVDATASNLPLVSPSLGVVTSTTGGVAGSGAWLGATLETPAIHSPWPFLDWSVYNGAHDFFVSLFGDGATTRFLMGLTGFLWSGLLEWVATGGPFDPIGDLEVIRLAKAGISDALNATKVGRFAAKVKGLGGAMKTWAVSRLPKRIAVRMAGESGPAAMVVKAFIKSLAGYSYDQYGADWLASQKTSAFNSLHSALQFEEGTLTSIEDPISTAYQAPVQALDPSYARGPGHGSVLMAALRGATADDTSGAIGNFSKAILRAYKDASGDEGASVNDVGYGPGIAIEFSQIFAAVIGVTVPSSGSYDLSASTLSIGTTRDPFDFRYGNNPTAPSTDDVAPLGSCTLAGVCTMQDGLTATVYRGQVMVAGQYPSSISWAPSGAWLVLKVNLVTTGGGQGPVYWNRTNIPFQGQQYDCWGAVSRLTPGTQAYGVQQQLCIDIDGAQQAAGVRWHNQLWTPTGNLAWSPSPSFDATTAYNPTTQTLISGF